jgi:hypothetical protein
LAAPATSLQSNVMDCPGLKRASLDGDWSAGAASGPDPAGGFTVSVAVRVAPPPVAVSVTAVVLETVLVVTVNCALVAPGSTVTADGVDATAPFELARLTASPPVGAALESVTVPVDDAPPVTLDGATVSAETLAGGGTAVTVTVAALVVVPCVAVIVAEVDAVTVLVAMVKVALVAPAGTVTLAGTVATALLLDRVTTRPPLAAALVSVTVPVLPFPPTTLDGLTASAESAGADGAACAVNRRELENGPVAPAELTPRTRQNNCCAGSPETVVCDTLTVAV